MIYEIRRNQYWIWSQLGFRPQIWDMPSWLLDQWATIQYLSAMLGLTGGTAGVLVDSHYHPLSFGHTWIHSEISGMWQAWDMVSGTQNVSIEAEQCMTLWMHYHRIAAHHIFSSHYNSHLHHFLTMSASNTDIQDLPIPDHIDQQLPDHMSKMNTLHNDIKTLLLSIPKENNGHMGEQEFQCWTGLVVSWFSLQSRYLKIVLIGQPPIKNQYYQSQPNISRGLQGGTGDWCMPGWLACWGKRSGRAGDPRWGAWWRAQQSRGSAGQQWRCKCSCCEACQMWWVKYRGWFSYGWAGGWQGMSLTYGLACLIVNPLIETSPVHELQYNTLQCWPMWEMLESRSHLLWWIGLCVQQLQEVEGQVFPSGQWVYMSLIHLLHAKTCFNFKQKQSQSQSQMQLWLWRPRWTLQHCRYLGQSQALHVVGCKSWLKVTRESGLNKRTMKMRMKNKIQNRNKRTRMCRMMPSWQVGFMCCLNSLLSLRESLWSLRRKWDTSTGTSAEGAVVSKYVILQYMVQQHSIQNPRYLNIVFAT